MAADEAPRLTDEQLDRIADRIAIRLALAEPASKQMLTVDDVSATFKVSRAWVYENAGRLGGVKLGPGERAPLRFDAERVARALRPVGDVADPNAPELPAPGDSLSRRAVECRSRSPGPASPAGDSPQC